MSERIEPIMPQVPVEGLAVHIGRAGLAMTDPAEARLMSDGRVGIHLRMRKRLLGLIPVWREGYLGHLGPVASRRLAPALAAGMPLRLRIVVLTPEHLAGAGAPEVQVSVWGDPALIEPLLPPAEVHVPPPLPGDLPAPLSRSGHGIAPTDHPLPDEIQLDQAALAGHAPLEVEPRPIRMLRRA